MRKQYLLGLISGIILTVVFSVNAAQSNNTIESCGSLLPEGHLFNMDISATINTGDGAPTFDGNFSVTDGSGASPSTFSQEQINPFIGCVVSLIE